MRIGSGHPAIHGRGHRTLPRGVTAPGVAAPQQSQTAARLKPSQRVRRHRLTLQPLKCVADRNQLDRTVGDGEILGGDIPAADAPNAGRHGSRAHDIKHFGLLVDRPHFGEMCLYREGDLAGTTGEIEQSPLTVHRRPSQQILDQRRRVADTIAVVEGRSSAKQVASKLRVARHVFAVTWRFAHSSASARIQRA